MGHLIKSSPLRPATCRQLFSYQKKKNHKENIIQENLLNEVLAGTARTWRRGAVSFV